MNGCYMTPVKRAKAALKFDPSDGLEAEMGFLVGEIRAGRPVPLVLAAKTFGTAVVSVYAVTLVLETLGVSGRLPLAVAAVLAPVAFELWSNRR